MKKLICLVIALTLAMGCAPVQAMRIVRSTQAPDGLALSWTCKVCGVWNPIGKFCTNCGTARPSAPQTEPTANSTLFPNSNDRYLLEWNGFTVEVLNIEQKLFSNNNAYLHFYTRCVNHSGHNLNMFIDQATVNGVPVDANGLVYLFAGYDTLVDCTGGDERFFFHADTSQTGINAICNAKSVKMTFRLVDGNTYEELYRKTISLENLGLPVVTPIPTVAPTPKPNYTALCQGDSGEDVKKLQNRLIVLGFLSGKADGKYGKLTAAAVRDFCNANGISASEIATPFVQEKLFASDAKYYTEPYVPLTMPQGARGEWKKISGNKLKFRVKVTNVSKTKTVKAFELYVYAVDIWGDRINGENTYYYDTTTKKIKPGESAFCDYFILPNRSEINRIYVGVKKAVFTDGTMRENLTVQYNTSWNIE